MFNKRKHTEQLLARSNADSCLSTVYLLDCNPGVKKDEAWLIKFEFSL
jgi:hypothetical protein